MSASSKGDSGPPVDRALLDHLMTLSRLQLDDAEVQRITGDLKEILDFVGVLSTLETEREIPAHDRGTGHTEAARADSGPAVSDHANVGGDQERGTHFREDEVRPSLPPSETFRNTAATSDGHFAVPPVLPGPAESHDG